MLLNSTATTTSARTEAAGPGIPSLALSSGLMAGFLNVTIAMLGAVQGVKLTEAPSGHRISADFRGFRPVRRTDG